MEFKTMVNRSVYVLFVVGLVIATLTSTVLQLLSIEEGEYRSNQFVVPNVASKDRDPIRIADSVDHVFTFVQVCFYSSSLSLSLHSKLSHPNDSSSQ